MTLNPSPDLSVFSWAFLLHLLRKKRIMENVNARKLNFGQRNWVLLCIIVAILSPLFVHSVQVAARKHNYREATEQKPAHGGDSASGGSVAPTGGSGSATVKDTSYKVAAPPQQK